MILPLNFDLGTLLRIPSFSLLAAATSASLKESLLLPLPPPLPPLAGEGKVGAALLWERVCDSKLALPF